MKHMMIEWQHLEVEGRTCGPCEKTKENILAAITELKSEFEGNIRLEFIDTPLTEKDIKDSNRVLLNGIPLEDIYDLEVKEAPCATCSDLVGREVCCRILVRENTETEEVPVEWIKEGVYLAIGERPSA